MKVLGLALGIFASLLWADTYPRQPGIDVQHYVFRVTVSDASDELTGETTVTVRFVSDSLSTVVLDLAQTMHVTAVSGAAKYEHASGRLALTLAETPKAGTLRQFTIEYHGKPASGLRFLKNKYGERCFFSANWPDLAHQWLPTVDHPSDKATGEFIVTAPQRYQVVANGSLEEEISLADGNRVTHWRQGVPIATWLYNIGVARFDVRHFGSAAGVPLQTWVYPQDRDAGIATFEESSRKAVEFYASHIGPYPYDKLADVQSAGNTGGMEHASAIFFGEASLTGPSAASLVAHETAHQWFGDSVTEKDWDDVWLSEGFATYFALLAMEHDQGLGPFVAALKRSRTAIFNAEKKLPGIAVVQTGPWNGIPNQIVYQKGGWVLHMLRGQLGAERFWPGIREYYRRYRDSNASTEDFRRVMEEVSGADLGWFFRQWLYRPGSPAIQGHWSYDGPAKKVRIDLVQTQSGETYRLPLEIRLGGRIERIELGARQQHFEIAVEAIPDSIELDPNTWILIDGKLELSKR